MLFCSHIFITRVQSTLFEYIHVFTHTNTRGLGFLRHPCQDPALTGPSEALQDAACPQSESKWWPPDGNSSDAQNSGSSYTTLEIIQLVHICLGWCVSFQLLLQHVSTNLVAWNYTNVLWYSSGVQKSQMGLTGVKKKKNQAVSRAVLLWRLEGNQFLAFFYFSMQSLSLGSRSLPPLSKPVTDSIIKSDSCLPLSLLRTLVISLYSPE